jgi:hypothetical protein
MASQTKSPTRVVTTTRTGFTNWTLGNYSPYGSSYRTRYTGGSTSGINTPQIRFLDFNFNIPSNATIKGFFISFYRGAVQNDSLEYVRDNQVQLYYNGGTGNNEAKTSIKWTRGGMGSQTYGGSTSLMGMSGISPSKINENGNSGFRLNITGNLISNGWTDPFDIFISTNTNLSVTVYYDTPQASPPSGSYPLEPVTNITATSSRLRFTIGTWGNYSRVLLDFYYRKVGDSWPSSPQFSSWKNKVVGGNVTYYEDVYNLLPDTNYEYYCGLSYWATDAESGYSGSNGAISYIPGRSWKTLPLAVPPIVTTLDTQNVGLSVARLRMNVTLNEYTKVYARWRYRIKNGTWIYYPIGGGFLTYTTTGNYILDIESLQSNTVYEHQMQYQYYSVDAVIGKNGENSPLINANIVEFTTKRTPRSTISNVSTTSYSVTISGTIYSEDYDYAGGYVRIREQGTTSWITVGTAYNTTGSSSFSRSRSDLKANTTYEYQAVTVYWASDWSGYGPGQSGDHFTTISTFTTTSPITPTVGIGTPQNITHNSVEIGGSLVINEWYYATVFIQYKKSSSGTWITAYTYNESSNKSYINHPISNLDPETSYDLRFRAEWQGSDFKGSGASDGFHNSPIRTFTTLVAPITRGLHYRVPSPVNNWREIQSVHYKIGSTWTPITEVYYKISGSWQRIK